MESAIDTYGRHRLLTFDRDPSTREPTVEVAHEALLGAWERLRGWIDEAREDVRMHRRLSDAASEWERSGREPSFLLTGSRLDQFESWGSTTSLALGLEERGYLAASVARRERSAPPKRTRARARADARAPLGQATPSLVARAHCGRVVAGTLTAIAINRNAEAQRASRLAAARELASAATANLERDRQLALLLALQAAGTLVDGTIVPEAEEVLAPRRAGHLDRRGSDSWVRVSRRSTSRPTATPSPSSGETVRSGCGIFDNRRSAAVPSFPRPVLY